MSAATGRYNRAAADLSALQSRAGAVSRWARCGLLCLAFGISLAWLAPRLEWAWLTRVAAGVVFVAALLHGRAAMLETRFCLALRLHLGERWKASVLPGLAELHRLCRRRLRAAIAAWAIAAMTFVLIVPAGLTYTTPPALRVYGLVLVLSMLRVQWMAFSDRRLLRRIGEHLRGLARLDAAAM